MEGKSEKVSQRGGASESKPRMKTGGRAKLRQRGLLEAWQETGRFREEQVGVAAEAGWVESFEKRLERECEPGCEGF